MFEQEQRRFDWGSVLVGILLIILGGWCFYRPDRTLELVAVLVGIGAIVKGVYELWFRRMVRRWLDLRSRWLLILGILDIILGLVFTFKVATGVQVIAIIFALWFIFDTVGQLFIASYYRQMNRGYYWLLVILNLVAFALGVILLFNPVLSGLALVWLIASFMILVGLIQIIAAF